MIHGDHCHYEPVLPSGFSCGDGKMMYSYALDGFWFAQLGPATSGEYQAVVKPLRQANWGWQWHHDIEYFFCPMDQRRHHPVAQPAGESGEHLSLPSLPLLESRIVAAQEQLGRMKVFLTGLVAYAGGLASPHSLDASYNAQAARRHVRALEAALTGTTEED